MRAILLGCLLLAGCEAAELAEDVRVRPIAEAPPGCRMIGTVRDAEGGGLRSFAANRARVETRLREEAARLGGDSLAVIDEKRGDTDEGQAAFANGVAGLTTPASRCSNCVALAAHVFQCGPEAPPPAHPGRPPARPPVDDD
jgi:hypothetical protein